MIATTRMWPLHFGHRNGSTSYIFRNSLAQLCLRKGVPVSAFVNGGQAMNLDAILKAEGILPSMIDLPNIKNAIVQIEKLSKYSLDPNHADGGDKAKVFKKDLGITAEDAEYLANALKNALPTGKIVRDVNNDWGRKISTDLEIVGKNGNTGIVRVAWQYDNGSNVPRLVTAYVNRRAK